MTIKQRLLKGATILGRLWREGKRCQSGWAPSCACAERTKFCGAKMFWMELAVQDARVWDENEWGVLTAMSSREIGAVDMTFELDHPEHGRVRVGKKGEVRIQDLAKLVGDPDAVDGFLKILKVFPRASVVRSELPQGAS